MSATRRQLRRAVLRKAAIEQSRQLGCRCELEIRHLGRKSDGVHRLDVAHDRECWLADARATTFALVDLAKARCER